MSLGTGPADAEPELKSAKESPRRHGHGGNRKWNLAFGTLIACYVLLAGHDLFTVLADHAHGTGSVRAPGAARVPRSQASTASPSAFAPTTAPSSPVPHPLLAQPHPLNVVSIVPVGPDGTSDGDNPGIVGRILDTGTDQPWYSQWYATPEFGNLRSGTGLLLDLGERVRVRSVQLLLGSEPGADIQVRLGNRPSADLPRVASVSGASGAVGIPLAARARFRYVLIWFTRLPPDGQGHYQISVFGASVYGTGRAVHSEIYESRQT